MQVKGSRGRLVPIVLALAGMLGVPLMVALLVQLDYVKDLDRISDERLTLYESTLKSELKKYVYLPFLVARSEGVVECLVGGGDAHDVNVFLEQANEKAGAAATYVLNTDGIVVAASNWRKEKNFIGLDLFFRPYFTDAIQGLEGSFYGVGITVGEPGYYISHPISNGREIIGVAVTKVALSPLQSVWQEGGETVFVADANGVIILSSRPGWRYRTLKPLSAETLKVIHDREQYPEPKLQWLRSRKRSLGLLEEVSIDKSSFFQTTRKIKGTDWEISYLKNADVLWERVLGMALTSFVLVGIAILLRLFLGERRSREHSKRQAREAERIRNINTKLAQEIEERKRTERELRAAQEELVQAGKLAAVGEMATAVAHELNQPIAAAKTYIASCKLMLEREKLDELAPTLIKVSELGDRMAKVTSQLKSFARKSRGKELVFDLRLALSESQTLMQHQFDMEGCRVELAVPKSEIPVRGDRVRFEQVLINLFRNALDSMQGGQDKRVEVSIDVQAEEVVVTVCDTGPGISPEIGKRLFEPFVTSKMEGVGVGLGLSISYKIIKDMGGNIRAANRYGMGAEFVLNLPLATDEEDTENE